MVKPTNKRRNFANRAGRNESAGRIEIADDALYFMSDLVRILQVCRQTIVRYKRDKGLPLSGVSRGSILGSALKRWLEEQQAAKA